MKERIRQLIETKRLKNGEFAEMLGINPAGISHILSGRNNPGYDLLKKILTRFPDVSADWLLLGSGSMVRDEVTATDGEAAALPLATEHTAQPRSATPFTSPELRFEERPATQTPSSLSVSQPGGGTSDRSHRSSNKVTRIVICYDDGTCESYTPDRY